MNGHFRWLHSLRRGNWARAYENLEQFREQEMNLPKKKLLLSLQKLAGLASNQPAENTEKIDFSFKKLSILKECDEPLPEFPEDFPSERRGYLSELQRRNKATSSLSVLEIVDLLTLPAFYLQSAQQIKRFGFAFDTTQVCGLIPTWKKEKK